MFKFVFTRYEQPKQSWSFIRILISWRILAFKEQFLVKVLQKNWLDAETFYPAHIFFIILISLLTNTVDIRYLEYLLSQTFTLSNFLFGPCNILINFPYKSVRYLELRYLEFSLCRTIFSVPSVIIGLFPIGYLEHSNEVFEWIILFILGIRMLITALTKLCSEVCSFFFSTSFQAATCPQLNDNSV